MTKAEDDNFKILKNKLKEILMYYVELKRTDNFEALIDVILMEQFVVCFIPAKFVQISYAYFEGLHLFSISYSSHAVITWIQIWRIWETVEVG